MPNDLPVIILARLAVDTRCRGQGIGRGLLREAISRSIQISEIAGVRGILVHAIDDEAARFYENYQFVPCPVSSQTLILPIDVAKRSL
jgi:predicted N-acetyltransferase YhbS